jgi:hypothetical protein
VNLYLFLEGSVQHGDDILSLYSGNVESLGPSLKDALINVILCGRVRKGETKREGINAGAITMVSLNKLLKAVCNIFPKFIRIASLELLWHTVLGLKNVEFGFLLGQGNLAHAQVGAAHVKSKKRAGLVAIGE